MFSMNPESSPIRENRGVSPVTPFTDKLKSSLGAKTPTFGDYCDLSGGDSSFQSPLVAVYVFSLSLSLSLSLSPFPSLSIYVSIYLSLS